MKKLLAVLGVGFLTLLYAVPVSAITMSITPSSQSTTVGGGASVDITVSGLNAVAEIVSAFDIDLLYDPAILTATSVNVNDLAFGGVDSLWFTDLLLGAVDINLTSFLSDADVDLLQGDSVLLATVNFQGLADGVSILSFDTDPDFGRNVVGRNALSLQLTAGTACVAVGTGACQPLPEPSLLALMVLGLVTLGFTRSYHPLYRRRIAERSSDN